MCGCGLNMEKHYQQMRSKLINHDYNGASAFLDSQKTEFYSDDNRLLFYMNKGMVLHLGKHFDESNSYLEQAKKAADQLWTESIGKNAAAWLTTDNSLPYQGEDFEKVLLHFVESLNYISQHKYDGARVETRQVTEKLQLYNSKYEANAKNVYQDDAFCRWLAGKLAETDKGDIQALNDAWIDYKKSLSVYENDYARRYSTYPPTILVEDALRVLDALKGDFKEEFAALKAKYPNVPYLTQTETRQKGEIVLLHMNGEAPYKKDDFWTAQAGFEVIRIAFPQFVRKPHRVAHARLMAAGQSADSVLGEDITAIAIQNLDDHMGRIKAKAIARQVSKYVAAKGLQVGGGAVAGKNQAVGTAMQVAGFLWTLESAIAEEADKRSWITLPSDVGIARLYVEPGKVPVTIDFVDSGGVVVDKVQVEADVKAGETAFIIQRTYL
jgi:uncharacterized protein